MSLLKYEYDKEGNRYIVTIDGEKAFAHEIYVNGQKVAKDSGEIEVCTYENGLYLSCTSYEKPALGVKPCVIAAEERISELAGAIKRQVTSTTIPDLDLVRRWASEITNQCDIVEYDNGFAE